MDRAAARGAEGANWARGFISKGGRAGEGARDGGSKSAHKVTRASDCAVSAGSSFFPVAVESVEQLKKPIRNGLGGHGVIDRSQLIGDVAIHRRARRGRVRRGRFRLPLLRSSRGLVRHWRISRALVSPPPAIVQSDARAIQHEKPGPNKRRGCELSPMPPRREALSRRLRSARCASAGQSVAMRRRQPRNSESRTR